MARPRRAVQAAAAECAAPPDALTDSQSVARVVKDEGSNLYTCALASGKPVLVELEARFRKAIWIRRGGYVVVDVAATAERKRNSRVVGDIVNVVRDERAWRKKAYWPTEFVRETHDDGGDDDDDDGQSTVGKMPPSDSDSDQDR